MSKLVLWFLHSILCIYLNELGEGFEDKNEGDEKGEDLLREGGDVAHEEAPLGRHYHQNYKNKPEPDPHSAREILEALRLAELITKQYLSHVSFCTYITDP